MSSFISFLYSKIIYSGQATGKSVVNRFVIFLKGDPAPQIKTLSRPIFGPKLIHYINISMSR